MQRLTVLQVKKEAKNNTSKNLCNMKLSLSELIVFSLVDCWDVFHIPSESEGLDGLTMRHFRRYQPGKLVPKYNPTSACNACNRT